jgi:hypothetical protein
LDDWAAGHKLGRVKFHFRNAPGIDQKVDPNGRADRGSPARPLPAYGPSRIVSAHFRQIALPQSFAKELNDATDPVLADDLGQCFVDSF